MIKFKDIKNDNGVRTDSKIDKLARLQPAFDKKFGTLTAANSSFLTDGASALLLMSEEKAKYLGLIAKAEIIDFTSKLYSFGMTEYNAKVGEWLDSQQ